MGERHDPDLDAAKQAIAEDAGADRGNDVTGVAADDKVSAAEGAAKGQTPSEHSVARANLAGADPEKG